MGVLAPPIIFKTYIWIKVFLEMQCMILVRSVTIFFLIRQKLIKLDLRTSIFQTFPWGAYPQIPLEFLKTLSPCFSEACHGLARMYNIKANFKEKYEGDTFCPFCRRDAESFEHTFKCHDGMLCPLNTHDITLESFSEFTEARFLKRVGKYFLKYEKFRKVVISVARL